MSAALATGRAALLQLSLLCSGCDISDEKKPVSAPLERSQVVQAKAGAAVTAPASAVATAAASAAGPPKAARALCAGQLAGPGRVVPKKPISQSVASGERPLPESPPLGGAGWTWVNFWAAWCAPCKEEIPRLLEFQVELAKASPGFQLGFVSVDDDERQLTGFLSSQPPSGLRRSYWLKEGKEREDWLKAAGLEADPELPFHLLFDPKGKLRCVVKGALENDDLPAIRKVLTQ